MQEIKTSLTDEEQANMQFLEIASDLVMGVTDPKKLIGNLVLPDGITEIGKFAFSFCSGLTHVTIPAGVTLIDREAFSACTSLTSVTIPCTVAVISSAAFTCCFNLPALVIPGSVTDIDERAFHGCGNLKTAVIASPIVKNIEVNAFETISDIPYISDKHFTVKTDAVKAMLKQNTAIRDGNITVEPNL